MRADDPLPLTTSYITSAVCSLVAVLYTIMALEPPGVVTLIVPFAPLIAVLIWLQEDARRTKAIAVHDWGFFLWIAWPFLLPWYALRTRGRQGWRLMLGLAALVLAPFLAAALVSLVVGTA